MTVKITINDKGQPTGKLADAELHFDLPTDRESLEKQAADFEAMGSAANAAALRTVLALDGLRLIGFSIWERRGGNGKNVTFPARLYSVNGERRSFALLRPIADNAAQERVREVILQAYAEAEERAAQTK